MANDIETRFWKFVDRRGENDCWVCKRTSILGGYTQLRIGSGNRSKVYCHRYAYELLVAPIPEGMFIDHICHNPSCVNPNHLRLSSAKENARNARISKRNTTGFKGVSKHGNKYRARIRVDYELISVGSFDSPYEAHNAYCEAAKVYHGDYACNG